jgi:hypothetical protein
LTKLHSFFERRQGVPGTIEDLIWVKADTPLLEITTYLYTNSGLDRLESISKFPVPEFVEAGLQELRLVSQWSIPTSAEMDSYRRESSTFNIRAGNVMVDELMLSDCVIRHHMRGLFIDGGMTIDLERDESSFLTVDSLKKLKSLHSGLFDRLYNTYKAEACLFT